MRSFFVDIPYTTDEVTIIGEDAHHISHVLRLKVGEHIIVVLNDGRAYDTLINKITAEYVTVIVQNKLSKNTEPPIKVVLAQGLPKSDKMEYIIQKAVELGVSEVIPLQLANCVVRYDDKKKKLRQERWQKIAQEAAKQCGRALIPTVLPICTLNDFLSRYNKDSKILMLYEAETVVGLKNILREDTNSSYVIIIGPEGGFSPEEVQICNEYNASIVTLGPRIMRTETASLAVLAIIMYQCGDIGGGL